MSVIGCMCTTKEEEHFSCYACGLVHQRGVEKAVETLPLNCHIKANPVTAVGGGSRRRSVCYYHVPPAEPVSFQGP